MKRYVQALVGFLLYFLSLPYLPLILTKPLNRLFSLKSDFFIVPAFGRPKFKDDELEISVKPILENVDCNAGKAFRKLFCLGFEAGASNDALAKIALQMFKECSVQPRIIAQWEVAYAIWRLNEDLFDAMLNSKNIFVLWPRGSYYPTYEVMLDAIRIIKQGSQSNSVVIAHPDHAILAWSILNRLRIPSGFHIGFVPYDRQSVQFWTKNPFLWSPKELLVRLHHIKHGWVSFVPFKKIQE